LRYWGQTPITHAVPPDRIDPGRYVIEIDEAFTLLSTEIVSLDINVNGQVSCQVVNIDAGPVSVGVVYP